LYSALAICSFSATRVLSFPDGWVGLKHLTSGDAVLTGDALKLFPFSVGQADYGAKVEVART
jgi:hypothetical protein